MSRSGTMEPSNKTKFWLALIVIPTGAALLFWLGLIAIFTLLGV